MNKTSSSHHPQHKFIFKGASVLAAVWLTACSSLALAPKAAPTPTATAVPPATATSTLTATPTPPPTQTRVPTNTPTPNATGTAVAQLRATLDEAITKIQPEMEKVGMKASDGHIVMLEPDPHKLVVN